MPIHWSNKKYNKFISNKVLNTIFQFTFDIFFTVCRSFAKIIPLKRNSICVISIHKLGDTIFTFDAVHSIMSYFNKDVFILCSENAASVYQLITDKKFIVPIERKYFHLDDRYIDRRARKILSKLKPEVIFDLTGVMTSASLIFNSRAKRIIGFNRKIFRKIFDEYSEFNLGNHSREIYLNPIKNFIPIREYSYPQLNLNNPIKKILIFPFAGWPSKEWSLYKFIELGRLLNDKYDVSFILASNNERILDYYNQLKLSYVITSTTEELINEIRKSDLVIGNDSGPVQIAAVLGKITFSIYGPTNPKFHLPKGNKNFYYQKIIRCSPIKDERLCFTDGGKNGCPSFECLSLITVTEVYKNLLQVIEKIEADIYK